MYKLAAIVFKYPPTLPPLHIQARLTFISLTRQHNYPLSTS